MKLLSIKTWVKPLLSLIKKIKKAGVGAVILALELSLIFCFFLGAFLNNSESKEKYNSEYWFYTNRGYPKTWAGISLKSRKVDFPIIKFPISTSELSDPALTFIEIENDKLVKIIDLSNFLPLFIVSYIFSYLVSFIFVMSCKENKKICFLVNFLYYFLFFLFVFVLFFVFPRI